MLSCKASLLARRRKQRFELKILKSVIMSNLESVFTRDRKRINIPELAKRNLVNHEITASFLDYWRYKTECQRVEMKGYLNFKKILDESGAAIVCSIHFGNYYLFPFELARLGHETVVVVGDQHRQYKAITDIAASRSLPVEVVRSDGNSLLRLISELKRSKVVYILIDEIGGAAGNEKLLQVSFLGKNLRFKKGVGALQYYSGVPVVPVISEIKGSNRSVIRIGDPLITESLPADRDGRIDGIVTRLFSNFEPYVLIDPPQWQKWVDLRRYEVKTRDRGNPERPEASEACLPISRERMKLLRDRKGYILVDMREGRYFALDKRGACAIKMMYRWAGVDVIAHKFQRKFRMTETAAKEYIGNLVRFAAGLS